MTITYLALNKQESLSHADISRNFLIDFVQVADSWELNVPTAQGFVPFSFVGEGKRIRMSLQENKLRRAGEEEMDPTLRSTILQAVCEDPRIGLIWVARFSLLAALVAETQEFQTTSCHWDYILSTAQQQLGPGQEEPKITHKHDEISILKEREMTAVSAEGNGSDILQNYQETLKNLETNGNRRLASAYNV
ncbi:unnamed protein product [Penicillium manginii]